MPEANVLIQVSIIYLTNATKSLIALKGASQLLQEKSYICFSYETIGLCGAIVLDTR